jgi:hypothetical protein
MCFSLLASGGGIVIKCVLYVCAHLRCSVLTGGVNAKAAANINSSLFCFAELVF